jgi:hypothetical protein
MPAPGGGSPEGIEIRGNAWGGYPTYGTDPGYPAAPAAGTQVYKGSAASPHKVSPLARDIYNCSAWAYDDAGNYSAGHLTDRGTSYYLGDFDPDGSTPYANWDGLVNVADLTPFSSAYSMSFPPSNVECDIGPTAATNLYGAYHRFAIPVPDSRINFEDLMIFAMNYQSVPLIDREGASIASLPIEEPVVHLEVTALEGDRFEVCLNADHTAGVKGMRCILSFDPAKAEFLGAEVGEVFDGLETFFHAQDKVSSVELSAAVLGTGAINRSGGLARVEFRALADVPEIRLTLVDLRDSGNASLLMQAEEDVPIVGPSEFSLAQNAPNPFGEGTRIRFSVPRESDVRIEVFDATGRRVRTLLEETVPAGYHRVYWDGMDDRGRMTAPGIFFYKMRAGSRNFMRKMVRF